MKLDASVFFNPKQGNLNIWWQGVALLSVLLLINLPLYVFDQRTLGDEALWIKPIKFEISVITHLITLAVLASLLSPERRNSLSWKGMSYVVVAASLFEVLYIFIQAARGRESHFNFSTPLESLMYGLMGLGAVLMVAGSFFLGWLLLREFKSERSSVLLLSAAYGLIIGSGLTLLIASFLSTSGQGYFAVNSHSIMRVPVFGWYLDGRDLRIPHFFATHMMQLIPLYGLYLSHSETAIAECKIRLYWVLGVYTLLVIVIFVIGVVRVGAV